MFYLAGLFVYQDPVDWAPQDADFPGFKEFGGKREQYKSGYFMKIVTTQLPMG
jgi:hypothetical protein